MILNQNHLDQRMSVDVQQQELDRISQASEGDVLFTAFANPNESIDTLLHMSGISYITLYFPETRTIQYVKES